VHEAAALERLADQVEDLVGSEGLGDVVVGAALDRIDGGGDRALAGDDDHLGGGPALLHAVEELETGDARQREVGEHDLELLLLELGDPWMAFSTLVTRSPSALSVSRSDSRMGRCRRRRGFAI